MARPRGSAGFEDRYGLVFVLLLLSYVLSVFSNTLLSRVIATGLYLATLLTALRAASLSRGAARSLTGAMVVTTLVVMLLTRFVSSFIANGLVALWVAVLTMTTLLIIVFRISRHQIIRLQTVLGALSAYLLIGFMFAALYGVTASWGSGTFFAGGQTADSANLQYFSFVTLTTTGYGDLTAAASAGRALAVMEALLGQIFLVTLVARLVSVLGTTRAVPARTGRSAVLDRDQHRRSDPR